MPVRVGGIDGSGKRYGREREREGIVVSTSCKELLQGDLTPQGEIALEKFFATRGDDDAFSLPFAPITLAATINSTDPNRHVFQTVSGVEITKSVTPKGVVKLASEALSFDTTDATIKLTITLGPGNGEWNLDVGLCGTLTMVLQGSTDGVASTTTLTTKQCFSFRVPRIPLDHVFSGLSEFHWPKLPGISIPLPHIEFDS